MEPTDLTTTPVHLDAGTGAVPMEGFSWDPEYLARWSGGRMVTLFAMDADWTSWEAHPAGEELVVCLDGRFRLTVEVDGVEHVLEVGPGQYVVNPPGAWHTADVLEPGRALFVTPGDGTTHRPR